MVERAAEQGKSLFQVILIGIFGAAILLAVGMFGYKYYLSTQIESKKATLASYESRLGTLPLEDMRKLSNRIKAINQLVKEHPSVNVAFRIVEDSIENNTIYERFDLRYSAITKSYALQLGGIAPDYKGVVQQIDTLKRKPYTTYVQNVSVEGLRPDEMGRVDFTLKMGISILGLLPEGLNLSEGAAERVASSTPIEMTEAESATTTIPIVPAVSELPASGTSTPNR
jgi:hypothetical protein